MTRMAPPLRPVSQRAIQGRDSNCRAQNPPGRRVLCVVFVFFFTNVYQGHRIIRSTPRYVREDALFSPDAAYALEALRASIDDAAQQHPSCDV